MLEFSHTPDQGALHPGLRSTNLPLLFVDVGEIAFHSLMELSQVGAAYGMAHGHKDTWSSLYHHSLINGHVDGLTRCPVFEDAGYQRRNTIEPVFKQAEVSVGCLHDDLGDVRLIGENLVG